MSGILSGTELLKKKGEEAETVAADGLLHDKVIALYFSAMWCPSCRGFTPKLKKFYDAVNKSGKQLEVVLVSRDRENDDLVEYFVEHNGDWLAIPFGDDRIQQFLQKYEIKTIPAMRVLKSDGSVAVEDARNQIVERGKEDPLALFEEWKIAAQ